MDINNGGTVEETVMGEGGGLEDTSSIKSAYSDCPQVVCVGGRGGDLVQLYITASYNDYTKSIESSIFKVIKKLSQRFF